MTWKMRHTNEFSLVVGDILAEKWQPMFRDEDVNPLFSETALLQTDCYSQDSLLSRLSRSVSRLDVHLLYLPI